MVEIIGPCDEEDGVEAADGGAVLGPGGVETGRVPINWTLSVYRVPNVLWVGKVPRHSTLVIGHRRIGAPDKGVCSESLYDLVWIPTGFLWAGDAASDFNNI